MSEKANWKIIGYGSSGGVLTEYVIEDRTEDEARHEAENELLIILSEDWTMTKVEDTYQEKVTKGKYDALV